MTSVACCALAEVEGDAREQAVRGAEWLLEARSRGLSIVNRIRAALSTDPPVIDQNFQIPGWGWSDDTTAWVEPTSWALLALKQLRADLPRRRVERRVGQGHALLADRMCRGGGWNYGNKAVLGYDLEPYPDTTAFALIALQDHAEAETTKVSIGRLRDLSRQQRSSLVLALAILALQLHGQDVRFERQELNNRLSMPHTSPDTRTLAFTLLALNEGEPPLRVGRDG
jgi:hypothetical protein